MAAPASLPFRTPGMDDLDKFKSRLMRTKTIASQSSVDDGTEGGDGGEGGPSGKLEKVLTTFDLISLGVGSCCGTGMYVVAGLVAKNVAGPGAIVSFFLAAVASILSGVCYGEFGVRVPKTSGSAYMYSYVTVGEFVAFLIGWNLILEYMIGSAAGASALSACFDALTNHSMSAYLEEHVGTVIGDHYPDFLGFFIAVVMTLVLAAGVKKSVGFNTALNVINFLVWVFIVIAGFFFIDGSNWTEVGFAPYGASGIFSGAATCFYAFIGFDIIATTGEEAKNPSRSIPIAIFFSLVICLVAYISVTAILTLMVPYYEIHGASALIDMFVQNGFGGAKWVVAIGAVSALTVSLLGSMFPMPRVIYAMSRDGLLFKFLSKIHPTTNTPMFATLVTGLLASFLSLLVSLKVLVEMMSIGTLLAYTLVSVSVLILRYQPDKEELPIPMAHRLDTIDESPDYENGDPMGAGDDVFLDPRLTKRKHKDDQHLISPTHSGPKKTYGSLPFSTGSLVESKWGMVKRHAMMLRLRLGFPGDDVRPSEKTARRVIIVTGMLAVSQFALCTVIVFADSHLADGVWWAVILLIIFIFTSLALVIMILMQPQNKRRLAFMAPAVPFLPCLAMFFNIYLMLKLPLLTWARLGVWILLGLLLYFSYSMWHSVKERKMKEKETGKETTTGGDDAAPTGPETGPTGQTMLENTPGDPSLTQLPATNTAARTDIGTVHQPAVNGGVKPVNGGPGPLTNGKPPGGPPMNGAAPREGHAPIQRQTSGPKPMRPPISKEGWHKMKQSSIERLGYFPAEERMQKELGGGGGGGHHRDGGRTHSRHASGGSSDGGGRYDYYQQQQLDNRPPPVVPKHNPFVGNLDDDLSDFDPLADSHHAEPPPHHQHASIPHNYSSGNNPFRQGVYTDDEEEEDRNGDPYPAHAHHDAPRRRSRGGEESDNYNNTAAPANNPYARPRPRPKVRPQNSNPFIEPLPDPSSDRHNNYSSGAW